MNKLTMNQVFKAVATERAYQEEKWSNPKMSPEQCVIYMQHHLNKAFTALSTTECVGVCDTVLDQIRKITGLGIACGEEHGMPIRPGYGDFYLFVAGDLILSEGLFYQCICSDQQQAVFGKTTLSKECLTTTYDDLFVVSNYGDYGFEYTRVSIDDIRRFTENLT